MHNAGVETAIDVDGLIPLEALLAELGDSLGSAELDLRIAQMIYPERSVVELNGEPVFWGGKGNASWEPVPRYSRSLDAAFEWERIVRVEKMSEGERVFWRARQYPFLDGDGLTEATARRVAALSDWITDKLAGPEPDLPQTKLPAGVMKPVVFPKGYGYRRPSVNRLGQFTMQPNQEKVDHGLMVQILLGHIRDLRAGSAYQDNPIDPTPAVAPKHGVMVMRKKAVRQNERAKSATAKLHGISNRPLSEVTKEWLFENRPRLKNKERMLRSVKRLIEFHGDRPIDAYTKNDLREFCNAMWDMPKYVPSDLRKLTMPATLEYYRDRPEVQRVTVKTIVSYQKDLSAIFNWALIRDMCSTNPAYGLHFIDKRLQSEKRLPFDEDDLKKIFMESPLYTGCSAPANRLRPGKYLFRDSLYWFGLAALFTAARLNEIGKSTVDDYRRQDGIDFLDIHQRRDNPHLKGRSADRQIPLHPMLIRLGFLDWVQRLRDKGSDRVFFEMFGRKSSPLRGWSPTWMAYQRGIGLTDYRKVFHSFRHTFKSACRAAGIQEEVHDGITGHRPFFSGRGYGGPVPLKVKYEAIKLVEFPNLDLSHLCDPAKLACKIVIDDWETERARRQRKALERAGKRPKS